MTKYPRKKTILVFGVGINDADYAVIQKVNGKKMQCHFYTSWKDMIKRCYSDRYHQDRPTYIGCTVISEWLTFSKFKLWMDNQDWQGKQLDKDILIQHNKIYSPESCIFVTAEINKLLNRLSKKRGLHPMGVSAVANDKYQSHCSTYGNCNYIGCYETSEEAHEAYKKFKYKHIAEIANQQSEPLRTALLNYKIEG
jgi:hypothetical protein